MRLKPFGVQIILELWYHGPQGSGFDSVAELKRQGVTDAYKCIAN